MECHEGNNAEVNTTPGLISTGATDDHQHELQVHYDEDFADVQVQLQIEENVAVVLPVAEIPDAQADDSVVKKLW